MLSFFKNIGVKKIPDTNSSLDFNRLPIMSSEDLITFTQQQNRIRSIKRIIKIDDSHFQVMYLDVIHKFAEIVQLMPASQAHHHAVPGGLFIHTLEVIEQAMNLRQQYKLPAFASQDVQERERHAWTYGVFASALLHDVGKRITMCKFIRDDDIEHCPFDEILISQTACKTYKIVFRDPKYHVMHEKIGLAMMDIFPPIGRTFLFNHLNIIKEIMAYIHGDKHDSGTIGQIISLADQQSTGRSLAHTPTRKFKGSSLENFGERLMTTLRQMIASNDFIVNKTNANIYVGKNGFTYCVSKVIADGIRTEMQKNNSFDVPADNNRIFDTLQEYGFTETNEKSGGAIFTICLYLNGNVRDFTVLKFKTDKLFMTVPESFAGVIEEVESRAALKEAQKSKPYEAKNNASNTVSSQINEINEPETENGVVARNNETTPVAEINNKATLPVTQVLEPDAGKNSVDNIGIEELLHDAKPQNTQKTVQYAKSSDADIEKTPETGAENNDSKSNKTPEMQLAENFLQWCRQRVRDKDITINESYGTIQKVSYKKRSTISLVTPKIFAEYATVIGLPNPTDKASYTKIQNAVHNNKLNIPAHKGQIITLKIKKSLNNPLGGNARISSYLFEIDTFVGDDTAVREIIEKIPDNTNITVT